MTHVSDPKWHESVEYRTQLIKELQDYGAKLDRPHEMEIEELLKLLKSRKDSSIPLTVDKYKQYKGDGTKDKAIMRIHGIKQSDFHEFKHKNNLTRKARENMADVTKPAHYHTGNIDVIKFAEENFTPTELKGFYRINVLKYVTRFDKKDGMKDLQKADFYLNKLIDLDEQK